MFIFKHLIKCIQICKTLNLANNKTIDKSNKNVYQNQIKHKAKELFEIKSKF